MKKILHLLFTFCLPIYLFAQPVQFNLTNKASISMNGIDTLPYPYTGGLNAPQMFKIELDGDGIKDLFVFDRYGNKVMTYLFKGGKYVYAPMYESQFPPLFKWVVIKDYNCDGKEDIFTEVDYNAQPEPEKYISSNGIRVLKNVSVEPGKLLWKQDRNQLMDTGLGVLPASNIAVSNSDFNAFEDIDNDGDIDILMMPFGKNVITYYQNLSKELNYNCDSLLYVFRDECWGYMSYLVNTNGFLLNDNSSCYRNYKRAKHNGTTLTMFDADADGDQDLIYGDVGFSNLVFLENNRSNNSSKRDSIISQDTVFPKNSVAAKVDIFPAAFIFDVDNDGKRDMVVAPNADAGAKNKDQILYYKNTGTAGKPVFTYQNEKFLVGETFDLGGGTIPCWVDMDADGDIDLVIATQGEFTQTANGNDRLYYFRNTGTSSKATYVLVDSNFLNINGTLPRIQRVVPTFGDLTGDGKPDLMIGDLNGKIHFYENKSNGSSIAFEKKSENYFNIFGGTSASPQLVDLNKDGKLDIVLGRKNGSLAYFENNGTATSANFTAAPSIDSIGKISSAEMIMSGGIPYYFDGYSMPHVCDLDKDGRFEILVGSDMGRLFLFNNFEPNATRVCDEITKVYSDGIGISPSDLLFGTKSAVTTADIDGDGVSELLIGNSRAGLRMYSTEVKGVISHVAEQANGTQNWVLYPNPAKSIISVRTDKNMDKQSYEIFDLMGKIMQKGEMDAYETRINILELPAGIYLLKSSDLEGNVYVSRFLIED